MKYELANKLDEEVESTRSLKVARKAIRAFLDILEMGDEVTTPLFKLAAEKCLKNLRFLGEIHEAENVHKALIKRFPHDPQHRNQLTVAYLIQNKWNQAKRTLEETLIQWPNDGLALVHYGFILKIESKDLINAVEYLQAGIQTGDEGTADGRFYFHLGDALVRLERSSEAEEVHKAGARKGLFLSSYQRAVHYISRLTGRPWWTAEQTTYEDFYRSLEVNWRVIKEEALNALFKSEQSFQNERENLLHKGEWKEFEIFSRGNKIQRNCDRVPRTCDLISSFAPTSECQRGQVKFSVMTPGTHIWPHCGPSNCRLRSHLGLYGLDGAYIRVANETRQWQEGKVLIFDDSFEHEVWHNGSLPRLVLIVDMWHPEVRAHERKTLPEI
ncbi:aspartyl/asparaginyl beta-hydroxylase-like [Orussus abietinus]|uniref:aspartyl/asparaginyl beta-hydroxylase-like n=1 Tax=Orussus abietinus TaxID=222816 RepID=UPI0006252E71|nr:aspartyl/asparaginyl beta-hydroxylase-like [Orussus abietinus]